MKTHPHLFTTLFCQPLRLLEPVRLSLENALFAHIGMADGRGSGAPRSYGDPGKVDENSIAYWKMAQETQAAWRIEQLYQDYGSVAVINLSGVIDKHMSDADLSCYGGCDLADVDKALAIAAGDDEIEQVVLNINSPGGSVLGVPETAARVKALTQTKQVTTFVDGMACSAAYYIGSQADQVVAASSAILGSIGVYCAVVDQSKALEMKGYNVQLIKAGKFKAAGAFGPLSDDERAMMQERVNGLHADFRAAVNGSRPQVSGDTMEGQTFDGKQSMKVGLCDGLTSANLDEYVAGLLLG